MNSPALSITILFENDFPVSLEGEFIPLLRESLLLDLAALRVPSFLPSQTAFRYTPLVGGAMRT